MNFNVFTAKKGCEEKEEGEKKRIQVVELQLIYILMWSPSISKPQPPVNSVFFLWLPFLSAFLFCNLSNLTIFSCYFIAFQLFRRSFFFLLEIKESTVKFIRCLRNCTPLCLKTVNRACKQTFNWYEKMPQRSNQRDARDMQQDAKIERYNLRYIGHKTFLMNKWNNEWMNKWTLKWPRYGMARKWNLRDQRLHYMHSICIWNTHTLIVRKAEKQSCNFS